MEKLTNYKYESEFGKYICERTKIDKGIYGFKIFSGEEILFEEEKINAR
ncbi:hypothetical protein LCGC14_2391010 [marine sediment metagenome]|uniref:Uncharacterized protein n=1 Tax=marine sediment metagenome TaxID=412755 RepID=A0A0F9EAH7_9ZZZZ